MEYFKKLSVKTIPQTIIDCPVRIQEIAILQDSFDKNILGRIKFVNQSKENVIAVFLDLSAKDISGEPVTLNNDSFIYQDICVEPGELYGNKVAINLPDATRILSAEINRVVFEDGTVWKSFGAKTCQPFVLEQIEQPQENFERIRNELIKTIPNIDYVNYYFQENESAWLCSCGKINPSDDKVCSFCGCKKSALEAVLTKEHFSSFCDNINKIVEEEEAEAAKIAAEKEQQRIKEEARKAEEERKRKEEENKLREEEANKERALREEEERRAAKRRKNIITTVVPLIVIAIIGIFALFNFYIAPNNSYNKAVALMNNGDYQSAYNIFESLNGFKDSDDQAKVAGNIFKEENYQDACYFLDAGDYDKAFEIFSSLEGYKDSDEQAENVFKEKDYTEACKLFYAGDYEESTVLFSQLEGYKDSNEFCKKAQDEIATGTHISFDMDSSECEDVLKLYIPADSIEFYNPYSSSSIVDIRAEITSTQAAQLTGLYGLQDITDIEAIQVSFSSANKMLNIVFDLKEIDDPSDFYVAKNGESNFQDYVREIVYSITHSKNINVSYDFHKNGMPTGYDKFEASFEFVDYSFNITVDNQNQRGEQQLTIEEIPAKSTSSESSSKSSSSGSSSSTHTCQASGCNKAGTHAITGLNGTTEYYCSEHYSQLSGMMDMIMGN